MNELSAQAAYARIASEYPSWYWTAFWRVHEEPNVRRWLSGRRGRGLDLGAGQGPYTSDRSEDVYAVDLSLEMLLARHSRKAVQADVRALPFGDAAFDWLLTTRMLSHIADPALAFREAGRVARTGAEWLITDVHPEHPYDRMSFPLATGKITIETYKHRLETITTVAAAAGFDVRGLHEWRIGDLVPPPDRSRFAKLYKRPDTPVFYELLLERR